MTDYQSLLILLNRFHINPFVGPNIDGGLNIIIRKQENDNDRFFGECYTIFTFTEDGEFVDMGAFE